MRAERCLRGIVATLVTASLLSPSSVVAALDAGSPPVEYFSPVYITAFQTSRVVQSIPSPDDPSISIDVPTDSLKVVEFHNETSDPIDLREWSVEASDNSGLICQISLSSWLLPDDYVVMASSDAGLTDSTGNVREFTICSQDQRTIDTITLLKSGEVQEEITPSQIGAFARKGTTHTYRNGTFTHDFEAMNASSRTSFYAGVWYDPLLATDVQISEILPRARSCSPVEVAGDCSDYVKLYNPPTDDIDLSTLRLRIGYQGQTVSSSNTLNLAGLLGAGQYGVFASKADGSPLSIANDGGWVWLEDTYGTLLYSDTVVEYPSASSVTKIGWAWAYNEVSGEWQWTSIPSPFNQASVFTEPAKEEKPITAASSLTPCRSDQYRNPLTNRCRLIASSTSSLKACAANQYRNPVTNRCKSLTSSTSSALKPCAANQERNPETNRCRAKPAVLAAADFPVETIKGAPESTVGWWAFVGVGSMAAGYAGWEWRRELAEMVKAFGSFFKR